MHDVNKKFWCIISGIGETRKVKVLSGDGPRKFSNTIGSSSLIDTGVRDVNTD